MTMRETPPRVSLADARALAVAVAPDPGEERIAPQAALGRVAARPVVAAFAVPHYRASAMDGFAVRAADTAAAPVVLERYTGRGPAPAGRRVCVPVDTGSPLPDWADAVVRIEDTTTTDEGVRVTKAVASGRDVRDVGEDIRAGALLVEAGRDIAPADVGAMLACGVGDLWVRRRPRIGILATGSEIVEPPQDGRPPAPGKVIDFNSRVLAGLLGARGAACERLRPVADDPRELVRTIAAASEQFDLLCVIAGSAGGRKDFTLRAMEELGKIIFRGVAIMPGRPCALAEINQTPVVAVPGYPGSAFIVCREIVEPIVDASLRRIARHRPRRRATLLRPLPSRLGAEEFVRVCLVAGTAGGDRVIAVPLARGAGAISTWARAHGLLRIPANVEGLEADSQVDVELLDAKLDPQHALVVATAADETTVALAAALAARNTPLRIAHVGLAPNDAWIAVRRGEAHAAVLSPDVIAEGTNELRIVSLDKNLSSSTVVALHGAFARTTTGEAVLAALAHPSFHEALAGT